MLPLTLSPSPFSSLSRRARLGAAGCLLAVLGAAAPVSAQAVLYAQNFGRPDSSSGRLPTTDWGWSGLAGTAGGLVNFTADTSSVHNLGIGADVGRPVGVAKVNASGTDEGSQGRGLLFFTSTTPSMNFLLSTSETSFNLADYAALTASWTGGNSTTSGTQRLAVQIGGNWYTTLDQVFTGPNVGGGSGFAAGASSHSVNLLGASWAALNTQDQLSLGAATELPSGLVTAFGIFAVQSAPTTNRFDSMQLAGTAIPEPATVWSLLAASALSLAWWRRRRAV